MILIIVILIIALALLAVGVNAIQQHKLKTELERRQQIHRYRKVLDETEDLIAIASDFPVGKAILHILRCRARDALNLLIQVQPNINDLKLRAKEYDEAIKNFNPEDKTLLVENFNIPDNDKQIVFMLQGLKKLRRMLRSEHGRNRVDSQTFHEEERRIEKALLRISAESLIRRGNSAFSTGMLGSARQYLEKAKRTLSDSTLKDEYITSRTAYIDTKLAEISESLLEANKQSQQKTKQQSELDELFQPKKKW